MSRDMNELFGELIGLLGEGVIDLVSTVTLPDGPKLSEFSLPYFFDENDKPPGSTGPRPKSP